MLNRKFHFIFYFYSPFNSCSFNYSNFLLLINNSFGMRHCNHRPQSRIKLLKLRNFINAKYLYEVIFFLYSIGYLNHCVHSPHFCWGIEPLPNFQKGRLDRISIFSGGCWKRVRWSFQGTGGSSFYRKNKLKVEVLNDKSSL